MSDNEARIAALPIWSGPSRIAPLSRRHLQSQLHRHRPRRQIRRPPHPRLPVSPCLPRPRSHVGARRPCRRLRARDRPRRAGAHGLALHRRPRADRDRRARPISRASPTSCAASTPRCPHPSRARASSSGSSTSTATMCGSCATKAAPMTPTAGSPSTPSSKPRRCRLPIALRPSRSAARQPHRRRHAASG